MITDYHGLATRSIENDFLRAEFLIDAGPRLVRLFLRGSTENWLAEVPHKKLTTPLGDYNFRGGHRFWYGPERIPETYQPDNAPIEVEELGDGTCLRQPPEPLTGLRKQIEIHLRTESAALVLHHRIENAGPQSIELAPWALTMLKLGGIAILPQTACGADMDNLLPNRNLVLWPYTRVHDARLELNDDGIRIHARAKLPPCKIGYFSRCGAVAYWRAGELFIKRFAPQLDQRHPDYGCNVEIYCNDEFIELETLAPLTRLEPGQSATLVETWELYSGVSLDAVDELMK